MKFFTKVPSSNVCSMQSTSLESTEEKVNFTLCNISCPFDCCMCNSLVNTEALCLSHVMIYTSLTYAKLNQ